MDQIVEMLPAACASESKAVELMEQLRWNKCPHCPHCSSLDVYKMRDRHTGQRNRRFLWRCRGCARQFTVRIGTVMQDSRIALRHWCLAYWLACASKKGVSALQIARQTGLGYKAALFMMHRIRHAMECGGGLTGGKLDGVVEVDETYVGGKSRKYRPKGRGRSRDKAVVVAVVQRDGAAKARVVPNVTGKTLKGVIAEEVGFDATIMTDDHLSYTGLDFFHKGHLVVKHSKGEYARKDGTHTNTVEGFFSIFKRALIGTYHAVSRKHLQRYATAFAFRWTTRNMTDGWRMSSLVQGSVGRRLRYDTLTA